VGYPSRALLAPARSSRAPSSRVSAALRTRGVFHREVHQGRWGGSLHRHDRKRRCALASRESRCRPHHKQRYYSFPKSSRESPDRRIASSSSAPRVGRGCGSFGACTSGSGSVCSVPRVFGRFSSGVVTVVPFLLSADLSHPRLPQVCRNTRGRRHCLPTSWARGQPPCAIRRLNTCSWAMRRSAVMTTSPSTVPSTAFSTTSATSVWPEIRSMSTSAIASASSA